jgi:hypothetical protein
MTITDLIAAAPIVEPQNMVPEHSIALGTTSYHNQNALDLSENSHCVVYGAAGGTAADHIPNGPTVCNLFEFPPPQN